jgi:hypothetical protein
MSTLKAEHHHNIDVEVSTVVDNYIDTILSNIKIMDVTNKIVQDLMDDELGACRLSTIQVYNITKKLSNSICETIKDRVSQALSDYRTVMQNEVKECISLHVYDTARFIRAQDESPNTGPKNRGH